MKNTFGNNISITLFGESHGAAIGVVLDGIAPNIPVDFDKPAKELKLYFIDDFADTLSIKLKFVAADKDLYDAKMLDILIKERIKTANTKVSTGIDLVNIYFQPCCADYVCTEITLYKDNMMLAKYKVDEEMFFKSITGLAFGEYEFILKQFDKDKNVLIETQKTSFFITMPESKHYVNNGKPWISNQV